MQIREHFERIYTELTEINITLNKQHDQLKEHIRRTELLEKQIEPIKQKSQFLDGLVKLAAITLVIMSILHLLHIFL